MEDNLIGLAIGGFFGALTVWLTNNGKKADHNATLTGKSFDSLHTQVTQLTKRIDEQDELIEELQTFRWKYKELKIKYDDLKMKFDLLKKQQEESKNDKRTI